MRTQFVPDVDGTGPCFWGDSAWDVAGLWTVDVPMKKMTLFNKYFYKARWGKVSSSDTKVKID